MQLFIFHMEISAISEAAAGAVEIFCWEQLVLCGNCLWSSRDLGLVIFYSSLCPQAATAALKGLRFFKFVLQSPNSPELLMKLGDQQHQ